jgi:hypothetical protein
MRKARWVWLLVATRGCRGRPEGSGVSWLTRRCRTRAEGRRIASWLVGLGWYAGVEKAREVDRPE